MNPLIQFNRITLLFIIALLLACFGFFSDTNAVNPPPDGGYPRGNTAEGLNALFSLTTGGFNTAVGFLSLTSDNTGAFNTAIGAGTLLASTGGVNTATGAAALLSNTTGQGNTANGVDALAVNTTGSTNTAYGLSALQGNTTGGGNTALGAGALENNTTGLANIALGAQAGINVTTANNVICIGTPGNNAPGTYIGGINAAPIVGGIPVLISSDQLGTSTSSRRFKESIKFMDNASKALFSLKPVSFRYKKEIDPAGTSQLGLVAEDVEKVDPNLVVHDKEGKPYSVRYDQVNAMLLNEFLKEHRKVQQLEASAERQQKQIEALTAVVQKVSAQLELSKVAPQTVNNP